jgi:hypothetical protein
MPAAAKRVERSGRPLEITAAELAQLLNEEAGR